MDFEAILKEQRGELERIEREENIVAREKRPEAEKALRFPNILAVLGIRRCGKSIFAYLLTKGKTAGYVNFDDERLLEVQTSDLNRILEAFYKLYGDIEFVVLDEVQNIRGWELFANRLRRTRKVILTGSNSRLLSGELATHLTGRHLDIVLFPFSFSEFLAVKGFRQSSVYTTEEKARLLTLLEEYLQAGGFPEVQKFGRQILPAIYEDILTKDVILRHKIKKISEMKRMAKYLITNAAQEFTCSKTAKIIPVQHVSTVSKWLGYLEEAFLVFRLERFDFKLKQQFLAPKKIYCVDTGIINTVGFKFSEDKGRILENAVATELKRRAGYDEELYYWKDHQQNEVDFVIKRGARIDQLVQATCASTRPEVKERAITALLKASKALKCKSLQVVTWDFEATETIEKHKVTFIPLWKWLLSPSGP